MAGSDETPIPHDDIMWFAVGPASGGEDLDVDHITHLVDIYSEKKLVQFWTALLRSRSVERASRRAFRRDFVDLEKKFREMLGAT